MDLILNMCFLVFWTTVDNSRDNQRIRKEPMSRRVSSILVGSASFALGRAGRGFAGVYLLLQFVRD